MAGGKEERREPRITLAYEDAAPAGSGSSGLDLSPEDLEELHTPPAKPEEVETEIGPSERAIQRFEGEGGPPAEEPIDAVEDVDAPSVIERDEDTVPDEPMLARGSSGPTPPAARAVPVSPQPARSPSASLFDPERLRSLSEEDHSALAWLFGEDSVDTGRQWAVPAGEELDRTPRGELDPDEPAAAAPGQPSELAGEADIDRVGGIQLEEEIRSREIEESHITEPIDTGADFGLSEGDGGEIEEVDDYVTHPRTGGRRDRFASLRSGRLRERVVREIYNGDAAMFDVFLAKLSGSPDWKTAKRFIAEELLQYQVSLEDETGRDLFFALKSCMTEEA